MPITTIGIGAAVTPTVIKTYLSHYTNRTPRRQKPTAHISYDEGLNTIRSFLTYASHHTVEELQAFTAQWVPSPSWIRTENVPIPQQHIDKAADTIIKQLGDDGVKQVGGTKWWQWRRKDGELKAEWIEMRTDYNARKHLQLKSKRIMLYVHGGAYFFGSVDEHRYQMQRHARKLKARVFAPRYRLSPQFPFPCGLQDCLAAYLYLLTVHDQSEIILAGDSAGGGMVVSLLCTLRDQGLPLPAGAVLISPWVDLTHSFPSVAGDNEFDYIPAHGFMQKPSASWPPPNDDDMEAIRKGAGEGLVRHKLEKKSVQIERLQGFSEHQSVEADAYVPHTNGDTVTTKDSSTAPKNPIPGPNKHLTIEIGGKLIELRDQIQMYATNQLISHPLVSPVLQPSLGGLPPLLILTGGGEVLRDEQIYLAHKAANPAKYPLAGEYQNRYDPDNSILNKHKPTPVQLQVWEDLCHVAPTLSFTRPAKFMYRSIAQFGAWALARAQGTSIEMDDDDASSISGSESDSDDSTSKGGKQKAALARELNRAEAVGRAGDPIPPFKNHMIRQRVDRHGTIYPLAHAHDLPALQLAADQVGVIKIGPVKKWMDAKKYWDTKYARSKRRVQQKRIKDLTRKPQAEFGDGEIPPPSALAGRQHEESEMITHKLKKSFGLAMWSGWGSKHDETTIKKEDEEERKDAQTFNNAQETAVADDDQAKVEQVKSRRRSRASSGARKPSDETRNRSRRRTISVRDEGQVEGSEQATGNEAPATSLSSPHDLQTKTDSSQVNDGSHLSPLFLPNYKQNGHHDGESRDVTDAASINSRLGAFDDTTHDNASTMAVFAAPGVTPRTPTKPSKHAEDGHGKDDYGAMMRREQSIHDADNATPSIYSVEDPLTSKHRPPKSLNGYDTPVSRRSVERLMSHQVEFDDNEVDRDTVSLASHANGTAGPGTSKITATKNPATTNGALGTGPLAGMSMMQPTRTASSMAVYRAEGVIPPVENEKNGRILEAEPTTSLISNHSVVSSIPIINITSDEAVESDTTKMTSSPDRPRMYSRNNTEYKTAMETL